MLNSELRHELKNILMDEDIFPLGDFETVPVHCERDGEAASYPYVSVLREVNNHEALLTQALENMELIGKKCVGERLEYISKRLSPLQVREILSDVGFKKNSYQSYSLRDLGTNRLKEFIQGPTREFFDSLGFECFRQQYAVAEPAWNTQFHYDHAHFRRHGFRAMVPLNDTVIMSFLEEGREVVFELHPGFMYFVNIASMHRAFNPHSQPRINLLFQMASDRMILAGRPHTPVNEETCETKFRGFRSTEIMEIYR